CLEALEANTVARIVALRPRMGEETSGDRLSSLSKAREAWKVCSTALADLGRVAQTLHNYQRVETVEDKVAYLAQAIEILGRLDREFQATLPQPEQNIC